MTKEQWLNQARQHKDNLTYLISAYHPAVVDSVRARLPITAPNAESASEVIREKTRSESEGSNPVQKFNTALAQGDIGTLITLLNQAWFGVPESTSCWRLRGFSEAVDLLEDPPYPDPEEEDTEGVEDADSGETL